MTRYSAEFSKIYGPTSRFDTHSRRIYITEYLGALKHICSVNLHIWTGFGARYMPSANTCGQKAVRLRKNKVNRDSQVKMSSCSAWRRRRPATNTAQLTSRSRLRTEQPRSISSSTSESCSNHLAGCVLSLCSQFVPNRYLSG